MIDYGQPANPEAFIIGALAPLGVSAGPERVEADPLPFYLVTSLHPKSDRHMLRALVSVASFGQTRAAASAAAWAADKLLTSLTPGDVVTLPDGSTAAAWVEPSMAPAWGHYPDPDVKRYVARYVVLLRYQPI